MRKYETRIELLETMLRIRAFDEKVNELFAAGKMHGTGHFYVGQEAVAVGVISGMREGDVITGTHRGHGHALAFGLDVKRMAAELLGKASGYCHGKGGSMHIADVGAGMLGANGIVAGSMGIVCGAAWAFKQRKEDRVAVCFFGDGAVQEGMFSEALNLAAVWRLPVVFVCENNQYAMSLSVERGFANARISEKAAGYGMPGVTVDGMELAEVQEIATEAIDRARSGGGPALIEANTYRYLGHSKSDANLYRTRDEIKAWRENDPIGRFVVHLEKTGDLEEGGLKAVEGRIYAEVEEAFEWAMSEPEPTPESALEDVYA